MSSKILFITALLAITLLSVGCSTSGANGNQGTGDSTSEDGVVTGSGCVPSAVTSDNLELASTTHEVASGEGMAMNTLDNAGSPVPMNFKPAVAMGSCGDIRVLVQDPATGELLVKNPLDSAAAASSVDSTVNWKQGGSSLLFDSECRPVVLYLDPALGLVEFVETQPGTWTRTQGPSPSGLTNPWYNLVGGMRTQGGNLAFVALAQTNTGSTGLAWQKTTAGEWELKQFDVPWTQNLLDLAVGDNGEVQAIYRPDLEYPCDPCDMDLYWASLEDDGSWSEELVQESQWGPPDDRYVIYASLVIRSDGIPLIAGQYVKRAITGSMQTSELRVYARKGGKWCFETVADRQDGYVGGDGDRFTGAIPVIDLDSAGVPYVAFTDITEWHDATGANGIEGNPRLAARSAAGWDLVTLMGQPGQTESANPLHGFRHVEIAVNPQGGAAAVYGVESKWQTNSIYNQMEVPISYKSIAFEAEVQQK